MDLKKYEKFYESLDLKEHPLGVHYTNSQPEKGLTPKEGTYVCMIGLLNRARRRGETVYFDADHTGCFGGAYYMGFRDQARPNIEYFLSCGIPGEMEWGTVHQDSGIGQGIFCSGQTSKGPGEVLHF